MSYLVLDLEMTGLDPGWHEIIQIGAVLYDEGWEEKGRYLQNVYPENEESYSLPALEVHGLTMEELEEAPMMHEALPAFEQWILENLGHFPRKMSGRDKGQILRRTVICGQSVINDINFLKFAYKDAHLKWPFANALVDLHTLAYFVFPILQREGHSPPKSKSLDAISGFFGYERETEQHNALEDAVLTAKCIKNIFQFRDKLKVTSS
ncbi:MAG: 3'-5' exonuclease [Bacteroidota bacterium]